MTITDVAREPVQISLVSFRVLLQTRRENYRGNVLAFTDSLELMVGVEEVADAITIDEILPHLWVRINLNAVTQSHHHKPGVPAHWMAYFAVSDCDATAAEAKNLGAMLYLPPTDFEDVGRISIMADPQGAALAIFKAAAQRASAP